MHVFIVSTSTRKKAGRGDGGKDRYVCVEGREMKVRGMEMGGEGCTRRKIQGKTKKEVRCERMADKAGVLWRNSMSFTPSNVLKDS